MLVRYQGAKDENIRSSYLGDAAAKTPLWSFTYLDICHEQDGVGNNEI